MTPKEAKENIGKEVVLDESTKPYGFCESYYSVSDNKKLQSIPVFRINAVDCDGDVSLKYKDESGKDVYWGYIHPRHLKLKEQPMNYKIKVTPETSEEVQELLFVLGYQWRNIRRTLISIGNEYLYTDEFRLMSLDSNNADDCKEITLPQLRDMVVLKRNNVSDATHAYKNDNKEKYYIGRSVYRWNDSCWKEIALNETYISCWLELIGADTQMTWQDALRAVADGKKIEALDSEGWQDIVLWEIQHLENAKSFRIAPQRITLHNSYTKEELLKIAGEME